MIVQNSGDIKQLLTAQTPYKRYIPKVYTFAKSNCMKTLSLKLDDTTFDEAEALTAQLNIARNRYINEAVDLYNRFNQRRILKTKLAKESALTMKDSMTILREFEKFADEN